MNLKQNKKGFSLIELLFVIGLIVFLTAVSMPITLGFFNDQVLDEAAIALKNNIKSARAKAMAGRASGFWGVRIEEDEYIIFNGKTFEDRNTARDISVNLPSGVTFSKPGREITFEKISGKPVFRKSLIGEWVVNEGEGCFVHDYSRFNNNFEIISNCSGNSSNWEKGDNYKEGYALLFDGNNEEMYAENIEARIFKEFTISGWFNGSNLTDESAINLFNIIYRDHGNTHVEIRDQGTKVRFAFRDINSTYENYYFDYSFSNNKWYHIVAVYDENSARVYVNNEKIGEGSTSGNPVGTQSGFMNYGMLRMQSSRPFVGKIDHVQKFDRALSEQEILALYENKEIVKNKIRLNFQNNIVELEIDELGNVKIN